jgi:hypothetical protein
MKLSSQLFKLSEVLSMALLADLTTSRLKVRIFRLLLLIKKLQGASAMRFDVLTLETH